MQCRMGLCGSWYGLTLKVRCKAIASRAEFASMNLTHLSSHQLRTVAGIVARMADLKQQLEWVNGAQADTSHLVVQPDTRLHWTQTPEGRTHLARMQRRAWKPHRP